MQSHSHSSAEKESRSVAHTDGKNNGVKAYPAISKAENFPGTLQRIADNSAQVKNATQMQQAIQRTQQPAQLFKAGTIANAAHLVSDDDGMAVAASGSELFLAKESVPRANPVLELVDKLDDYGVFKITTAYDSDCGIYADNLMRRIASFNRRTEVAGKETVNVQDGPIPKADPATLFQATIASQPAPGIGQAYLVVNDPQDPEFGKKHFNFHWGVVIARSGSDVMTAESGSHTSTMKFDMYSQSDLSQSFQQRYIDAKKLQENAKTFQVNFTKTQKQ